MHEPAASPALPLGEAPAEASWQTHHAASRIWIVDDQVTTRMVLEKLSHLLETSVSVRTFAGPREALEVAKVDPPDMVLVDFRMPGMDGVDFTRALLATKGCENVSVMVITSFNGRDARYRSFDAGAADVLLKPIDHYEFMAKGRNLLTMRRQQKILHHQASWLRSCVAEATREIKDREYDTLLHLARAGEYRDEDTGNHILRMARTCRIIAEHMGLSTDEVQLLECSAPMHDIGKIGISDTILLKRGRLTEEEHDQLKAHTTIGYNILRGSSSKYLQAGAVIALGHHERFDGKGYPGGLAGEEIPLFARIVAVADVYDALTSPRPYKRAWTQDDAVICMREESGRHFDPRCVEAFLTGLDAIIAAQNEFKAPAGNGGGRA